MYVVITINLVQKMRKILKNKEYKIINKRVNKNDFLNLKNQDINYIIIEEKCIEDMEEFVSIVKEFKKKNICFVVLTFRKDINIKNTIKIDMNSNLFEIELLEKVSQKVKFEKSNNSENVQGDNIIYSFSLDRKCYLTNYMLTLSMDFDTVYYFEKEQSPIDYVELFDLTNSNIVLSKFSIINNIQANKNALNIIDLGELRDISIIRKLLLLNVNKIFVFTTNCNKVLENDEYLKINRLLEKYNNVEIINRKEIFDSKIQLKSEFYKSKIIVNHFKKNNVIEEIYDKFNGDK